MNIIMFLYEYKGIKIYYISTCNERVQQKGARNHVKLTQLKRHSLIHSQLAHEY